MNTRLSLIFLIVTCASGMLFWFSCGTDLGYEVWHQVDGDPRFSHAEEFGLEFRIILSAGVGMLAGALAALAARSIMRSVTEGGTP